MQAKNGTLQEVLFLYKKQYGRLTVRAWLNAELERSNPLVMLTVGVLLTMTGILVRMMVGSPYRTILELGIADLLPPVWLMTVLWSAWMFILGCAAGFVLGYRGGCREEKYKGWMYFTLFAVISLCWYPAFFGGNLVFISALLTVLILCLSLAVTFCFYRVTKFAGMLFLLHDIWLIYMLILSFSVLFHG